MEFKNISLKDKELFDSYFETYSPLISEYTFTNLFAWRESKKTKFAIYNNHLLIKIEEDNSEKFMQPIGINPKAIIIELLQKHKNIPITRIDKKTNEALAHQTTLTELPDHFDYVYDVKEMISLQGNKFEPKRNLIKQFEKEHPIICELTEETVPSFLRLHERWCDLKGCSKNKALMAEDYAVKETLKHFKLFNLLGICVHVNGNIEGFSLGEKLNNDTYVNHFEKADPKYKGIYQYILREFAKKLPKNIKFINREQDLGIEGLKKAKKSYNPVFMVKKYETVNE